MATVDLFELKKELINFFRNQDIISTTTRGVTTTTETFSGNASDTEFDLANSNVKNVRLIQISSVTQSYGTDYTIDFDGSNPGRITFSTAPPTGSNNISIQYDYGNSDRIYPDFPRADLKIGSYPRIALEIQSMSSENFGIGGTNSVSNLLIEIVSFDVTIQDLEDKVSSIRDAIINNQKSFYNFNFIHPINSGPLLKSVDRNDEILQRNTQFQILNEIES